MSSPDVGMPVISTADTFLNDSPSITAIDIFVVELALFTTHIWPLRTAIDNTELFATLVLLPLLGHQSLTGETVFLQEVVLPAGMVNAVAEAGMAVESARANAVIDKSILLSLMLLKKSCLLFLDYYLYSNFKQPPHSGVVVSGVVVGRCCNRGLSVAARAAAKPFGGRCVRPWRESKCLYSARMFKVYIRSIGLVIEDIDA